ncbi:MAG: protein kinase, partial [Sandaracinaceae bacterium]|nr:protein kinase [Sandaracinaceae bacterium]
MRCLDDATLERMVRGEVGGAALQEADEHLDGCAECRARLGRLARRAPRPTRHDLPAARALEPAPDPYLGKVIAERYLVRRRIGGGGMGTVYEAEHVLIGRRVAIKVLLSQWASERDVVRRFQNEARAAGTLRHPGILQALDMGRTEEGTPYLVLDYLEGRDLDAKLTAEAPLPIGEAVAIVRTIADAVGAAHAAGIIHRDLKPENVFVTHDGQLKVLDFGISKFTSALVTGPGTTPGAVMGTPMYMAPEQFEDASKADPRSDLFALGVILYRALTGALPFVADTLPGLLIAMLDEEATPPSARRPEVPAALDAVVMRALRARPDDRFTTVEELRAALAPFAAERGAAAAARPPSIPPARRDRRVVSLLCALDVDAHEAATREVSERGGRVLDEPGFYALFGETTWHGDDALRAVEAALAVRPHAQAVGVVTGYLDREGRVARSELAQRAVAVCALGGAGVAVASPPTRLAARFALRPLGPDVVEVLAASPASAPEHLPLAGRTAERAWLAEAIERARDEAQPIVSLLVGEPGIGKSRLVAEALSLARDGAPPFTALVVRGVPQNARQFGALAGALLAEARAATRRDGAPRIDAPAPLEERREAVRRLAASAVGEARARDAAEVLGELLDVAMPPSSALSAARSNARLMRDRKASCLAAYLGGLAARGPLLIVLEDLSWIDEGSLAVVARALGAELWARPVAVLGTARAEVWSPAPPFDDADVRRLELRGLGLAGVRALADAVLPGAVGDELARRLLERTGGNPLFVEETLRALAEDPARASGSPSELPLPLDVEAAVRARLDALSPEELDVATRGAVLGGAFGALDLEALGASEPSAALSALEHRGIVRRRHAPDDTPAWELRAPLTAEVLLRDLEPDAARALHLRAAGVWRAREERLWTAWHFERAGEPTAAAAEYAGAALEAARGGDGARVLACAEPALALGVAEETELALQLARAEALEHAGRLDEQGVALARAAALVTTPDERAAIGIAQAVRALRQRGPAQSLPAFEGAVEAARDAGAPAVLARALGAYAT